MLPSERATVRLPLSTRELQVSTLYADGFSAGDVGTALQLQVYTVRGIIGRAAAKYSNSGRPTATRLDLRQRLVEDGIIQEDITAG